MFIKFLQQACRITSSGPHQTYRASSTRAAKACDEGLFSQIQSNVGAGGHWLRKPELSRPNWHGWDAGWSRTKDLPGIKIGPRHTIAGNWFIRDSLREIKINFWANDSSIKLPKASPDLVFTCWQKLTGVATSHPLHNCSSAAKSSRWDHPLLRCQSDPIGMVRRSLVPTLGSLLRRPWQTLGVEAKSLKERLRAQTNSLSSR